MLRDNILKAAKAKWIILVIVLACIALGLYNGIFSLIGLLVCVCVVVACPQEDVLFIIFFVMSFANIFKMSPTGQSFFTYILLFYVLYQITFKIKFDKKFLIVFLCLLCVLSVQFLMSMHILRTIKFVTNILFVYIVLKTNIKKPYEIFKSYIIGVIVTSVISLFDILPNLDKYLEKNSTLVGSIYVDRFSGLYPDPNYYAVNIIIALCLTVILYHKKIIKVIPFVILALILLTFAILTYSKSVFLMLILPIVVFLYSNSKNRRHFIQLTSIVGISVFAVYMLAGKVDFLSIIFERISKEGDLNTLTTGRYELWVRYYEYFLEQPFKVWLGNGLGAELIDGEAAHNTYIDLVYYLGILGSGLVFVLLFIMSKINKSDFKRNILNYSVLLTILPMYFFLSQLFYFDMPFHILILIMVNNVDMNQNLLDRGDIYGQDEINNMQNAV